MRRAENKNGWQSGVRVVQMQNVETVSNCVRKTSTSVRPVGDIGKRQELLGARARAGAVNANYTEWL